MSLFKGFRKLKTRLSPSRPHSPVNDPPINRANQGPSRSPTPSPSTLGRQTDTAALFMLDNAVASESTLPVSPPPPDSKAKVDDDTPTIAVEEAPASPTITVLSAGPTKHRQQASFHNQATFIPIQLQDSGPPKRRFAQSASSQRDIVVLHVAYVVRDSTELQELILEIVRISNELDVCFYHFSSRLPLIKNDIHSSRRFSNQRCRLRQIWLQLWM